MVTGPIAATPESIVARIERLPLSSWQIKMASIVGVATFFDAFDALTIAYVLPVLIRQWQLKPEQIGLLISTGYIGQFGGALFFGWLAERVGRLRSLTFTALLFGVMSLFCMFAWDYNSLFWGRLIQGIGLGGEVPVAAAYVNEWVKARGRGSFVVGYEFVFAVGLLMAALLGAFIVPKFGWQWMFLIGAVPALLAVFLRRVLPESPRWLATHGRLDEADKALRAVEDDVSDHGAKPLPEPAAVGAATTQIKASLADLFGGIYLKRTLVVWVIWFCTYFVTYGLTTWLPSLYSTVFKLPLAQSLQYGLITQAVSFCFIPLTIYFIDKAGRRPWFTGALLISAVLLLVLGLGLSGTPNGLLIGASLAFPGAGAVSGALYLYTPELYPTRIRALGTSVATAWLRLSSAIGPIVVGLVLARAGLAPVFIMFAVAAALAGLTMGFFGTETKNQVLEAVSP